MEVEKMTLQGEEPVCEPEESKDVPLQVHEVEEKPNAVADQNLNLDLPLTGHFKPLDIVLNSGEFSDSPSFLSRFPVLSVNRAFQSRKNCGDKIIISQVHNSFN